MPPRYPSFPTRQYVPKRTESPYGDSIGELMLMRGPRLRQQGSDEALLWAHAGNQVQNAVGGYVQQREYDRQAARQAQQDQRTAESHRIQTEAANLQLGRERRQTQAAEILGKYVRRSDEGMEWDIDGIAKEYEASGLTDQLPAVVERLNAQNTTIQQARLKNLQIAGSFFAAMPENVPDDSISVQIELLKENGFIPRRMAETFTRRIATGQGQQVRHELAMLDENYRKQATETTSVPDGADLVRGGKVIHSNPRDLQPRAPQQPNEATIALQAAGGDPQAAAALKLMQPQGGGADNRVPIPVLDEQGNPVYVRPNDAVGKRPASTREQGRQVTSGDAGRIAEFDTSLDDVRVLRGTIAPRNEQGELVEPGATGTVAKVAANVPNFVTEWTGIGATSKSKQAVIDRVKQVIGKALEGGVLRKEDEYKYTKILPTIGDTVEVVEAKLNGLEEALVLRRERTIEALADAGYDTARFTQRDADRNAPAPLAVGAVRTVRGQQMRITKVYPDGTFDAEPVK